MSAEREPYTVWATAAPFRKNGTPIVGNVGSSIESVVIMKADTFKRLVNEPGLAQVEWRLGTFE